MNKTYKFELPQNKEVESTKVRIKDGKVFVDVEFKEKFQPKDGDFLISSKGGIFIHDGKTQEDSYRCYCGVNTLGNIQFANLGFDGGWTKKKGCRYATELEKNIFLERLEKECGKRWNAEKKLLEDVYVPKFGDIVKVICSSDGTKRNYMICIMPEHYYGMYDIANINKGGDLSYMCGNRSQIKIQPASESEKQELFDKLAEEGKRWNPETKQLEDIRWRAKKDGIYYTVTICGHVVKQTEIECAADFLNYKQNNYFRTPESAQKVADQIKEIFKNSEV